MTEYYISDIKAYFSRMTINMFLLSLSLVFVGVSYAQINESLYFNETITAEIRIPFANSSLLNCIKSEFSGLIQQIAPVVSNFSRNQDIYSILNVFTEESYFAELCRNLDGFDACLRDTPTGSDDEQIQPYINYNNIVPTLRNFFCRNDIDGVTRYRCTQETFPSFFLCGWAYANILWEIQSNPSQIGPATLCPWMDSIFKCQALQIRSCDQTYADDYLSLRNVYSDECRTFAENSVQLSPVESKLLQCSFSLATPVLQSLNKSFVRNSPFSQSPSVQNKLTTTDIIRNMDTIVSSVCSGLGQFFDCVARETRTSSHYIDVVAREIADLANPSRLLKAMTPVCDFARRYATQIAALGTCNVTACFGPISQVYTRLNLGRGVPGTYYRSALCRPIATFVKCESAALRECNENIGSLIDNFASGILREDCGGRLGLSQTGPGNSSQRHVSSAVIMLLITLLAYIS